MMVYKNAKSYCFWSVELEVIWKFLIPAFLHFPNLLYWVFCNGKHNKHLEVKTQTREEIVTLNITFIKKEIIKLSLP